MAWEREGALVPGPGSYEHLDAFHPLYAGVCVCAGERADVCQGQTHTHTPGTHTLKHTQKTMIMR